MDIRSRDWLSLALPPRYRLIEPLPSGAQGVVWRAVDSERSQEVVIKLRFGAPDGDLSLRREVAALLALDRPCVSRLLDVGVARGPDGVQATYLVTAFVSGPCFPELGRHAWPEVRVALVGLLRALRHVHGAGVVHRDLRPDHVRLRGGEAVLLDFGAAAGEGADVRGPQPRGGAGTYRYMAPEVMLDPEEATFADDLYSVGVMLYEALADRPPHDLNDLQAARRYDEREKIRVFRPDLPDVAIALVEGLLARRSRRIGSAESALELLGQSASAEINAAFRHWGGQIPAPEALADQLYGPERIFGRRTRALALLRRRAGRPEEIAAELSAWLAAGRARQEEGHIVIDEADLAWLASDTPLRPMPPSTGEEGPPRRERLHALLYLAWPGLPEEALAAEAAEDVDALVAQGLACWTDDLRLLRACTQPPSWGRLTGAERAEVHARIAELLLPESPSRVRHLLAAGEPARAVEVAITSAEALYEQGFVDDALTRLDQGLMVARSLADLEQERRLLSHRTWMALSLSTDAAAQRSIYEITRSNLPDDQQRPLLYLLEGVRAARHGRVVEARQHLLVLQPFADERLDRWRAGAPVEASLHAPRPELEAALEEARRWAEARGTASAKADLAGWEGNARYREGAFTEALAPLRRAVASKGHGSGRVSSWGTLVATLLELRQWDEARQSAAALLDESLRLRVPTHAAVAEWTLRAIAWRQGQRPAVDRILILASQDLRRDVRRAQILLTEAAFAWRSGMSDAAASLASDAAGTWRAAGHGGCVMAEALAAINRYKGIQSILEEAARAAVSALAGPLPGLALQGLAVLLQTEPALHASFGPIGRAAWERLPPSLAVGVRELVDLSTIFGPGGLLDHNPPGSAM